MTATPTGETRMRFHFQCPVCGHRWTAIDQKEEPMCPKCLGTGDFIEDRKNDTIEGETKMLNDEDLRRHA